MATEEQVCCREKLSDKIGMKAAQQVQDDLDAQAKVGRVSFSTNSAPLEALVLNLEERMRMLEIRSDEVGDSITNLDNRLGYLEEKRMKNVSSYIDCIKLVRSLSGLGLKASKDVVDTLKERGYINADI